MSLWLCGFLAQTLAEDFPTVASSQILPEESLSQAMVNVFPIGHE